MKSFGWFLSGCLVTAGVLSATSVFAETKSTINAVFGRIQLVVNGQLLEKETLLYDGTTYIPLRAAAEVLDKEVAYNPLTQTAYIDEKGTDRAYENQINAISNQITIEYSDITENCTVLYGWPGGRMHIFTPELVVVSKDGTANWVSNEIWTEPVFWDRNLGQYLSDFNISDGGKMLSFSAIYHFIEGDNIKIPFEMDLQTGKVTALKPFPKIPDGFVYP